MPFAGPFLELQMFFGEVDAIAGSFLSCKFSLKKWMPLLAPS